jgi:L-asparaginase II
MDSTTSPAAISPLSTEPRIPDPATAGPSGATGPTPDPVLAEIVRSGFVEGVHRGRLVLLAADGSVQLAVGDVHGVILPRSCNKPMQAVGMLDAGLALRGRGLALAAASHAGERFHVDAVRSILADAGLSESALRTPSSLPLDDDARLAHQRPGGGPQPIFSDCSGKHAAMLAVSATNGWSTEKYLDPAHAVQRAVYGAIERLSGERVAYAAVDGCGAPLLGISLVGLARAFQTCATADSRTNPGKVAAAMRAHPEYVAGTRQLDTLVMRAVEGLIAKTGAEAVQAAALPDGRSLAFKISDGSKRAKPAVLAQALRLLGIRSDMLERLGTVHFHAGAEIVGGIRPVDW